MKKHLSFFIYLFLALILIFGNSDQRIAKANFLSSTIFLPFINTVRGIQSLFEVQVRNQELTKSLAQKSLSIRKLKDEIRSMQTTQLNFDIENHQFILGEVVGYEGRFEERNMIINKGLLDRVKKDHPVLHNDGIIGKIISVSQNYSIVLPLDHHQFKLGVMVERNSLQGLMISDIYGKTFMTMIKPGSDISIGDEIVTSTISSVFPKGYPVGKVTKLVEASDKLFMKAEISNFVDPAMVDQIIILLYEKDIGYEREFDTNR